MQAKSSHKTFPDAGFHARSDPQHLSEPVCQWNLSNSRVRRPPTERQQPTVFTLQPYRLMCTFATEAALAAAFECAFVRSKRKRCSVAKAQITTCGFRQLL